MSNTSRLMKLPAAAALSVGMLMAMPAHAQMKTLIVAEPVHGTGYLPLYVAMRNGYFAAEGLEIKILTVESGAGHTNAVLTKQAFAFIGGPEHNAFAKIKGAELRAVVNVVDRGNIYYVAKKGLAPAPGQSMKDFFKGKSVAVSFFGGTPNSITRYYLKTWGLDDKKDVTLKEMSNGAILAAVKTGGAQIGVTTEPVLTRGVQQAIWDEPFLNVPKDLGPYAYSTLNIRLDSIQQEPATVAKFVKGVVAGLKATYAEQDKALAIAKLEFPTMSVEDLKATLDRSFADEIWSRTGMISPEAWTTGEKVVVEAGILKKPVAYDEIIDMQFVKVLHAMAK
jgi:NitT/TauT family transport system substrate-binding protein